ncbi:glycoside hydrolase family 3 N-terminal domain-containing protein [Amnibacterium endophyticum]|uniref:Glycoside hydrolase family 3 N-terminal domain-containing protein n=1 Tax=Amnibacterium endophyticum TaxID=2109337 RepID=A0ABW4LFX2_9MICO
MRRSGALAAVLAAAMLLSGCAPSGSAPARGVGPSTGAVASAAPAASARPTPSRPPSIDERAAELVAHMSRSERAGQLLMTAATVSGLRGLASPVRRYHLGGVMVRGRSAAGASAVASALAPARAAAPDGLPLLTATDQEGGTVQVLTGPGFHRIPSAVEQGRRGHAALRRDAASWGRSLARAGVRLDLGPVADVPCASTLHDNPPVADLRRQYGSDPQAAGRHVAAFVRGMRDAGVQTTVKHFPGLGCVRQNTDTAAHVVDAVTTASSPRLSAFRDGIAADPGFVMMSSASYSRIDRGVPALFSRPIVTGLLRERLGFHGVVMSDDVGGAVALRGVPLGERATRFVAAGGDLVLDIVPAHLPVLHGALMKKAASDPAFDARLTAAAERVVAARLRQGELAR